MPPAIEAHFFAAHDLNGPTIFECSTDDEFVKSIKLDIQRDKLGSGLVRFSRKVPLGLFSNDILRPEVFIRYLIPEVHATKYLWGNFLNVRQQKVISKDEKGGEGFSFGGPGPKFYLQRMLLWSASFAGSTNAVERESGVWTWPSTARAGAILNRLILEDQSNPSGPFLPDLTKSFSDNDDTDNVAWADDIAGNEDFTLRIQDDYLKILWQLEDAAPLITEMTLGEVGTPLMQLDAYQSRGRDLRGDLATDTVHFIEGVNIATDLDVEGASYLKGSHALVEGKDGVYELAVRPSWDPGEYKKVIGTEYPSAQNAVLDRAGVRFLQRQENPERQIDLQIVPGFDPASGLYFPGFDTTDGHFWVSDQVNVSTGGGSPTELDYTDEDCVVTGIEIETTDAVVTDTALKVARSFEVTVHLNDERKGGSTVPDRNTRGVGSGGPTLKLCRPGVFDAVGAFVDADSEGSDNAGTVTEIQVTADDLLMIAFHSADSRDITASEWRDGPGAPGAAVQALTQYAEKKTSDDHWLEAWYRVDPNQSLNGNSGVAASSTDGRFAHAIVLYSGLDASSILDEQSVHGNAGPHSLAITGIAAGNRLLVAIAYHSTADVQPAVPDGWSHRTYARGSGTHEAAIHVVEKIATGTSETITWATGSPISAAAGQGWTIMALVLEGSFDNRDGHPDLVGDSPRIPRCDHRHDVHRDAAPTVNDDWETQGYPVGTVWAQLDDLDDPTEIVAVWQLLDSSTGAAVWASWPTGTSDLEGLSDVDLTSPAEGDTLRFVSGQWINDDRQWEAVTGGEDIFVWEGDDLVHEWNEAP